MDTKAAAQSVVDDNSERLIELSHRIHAHPETCFEEVQAADWTASMLSDAGFALDTGVADLPTAYVASYGSGPLTIGICAEYDALPGIGHACGHNVIAGAAVGAGLALAPLADELGITVKVFGTPAEEGGGGKIIMLDKGVFAGVHAAMMVHPAPSEGTNLPCLAVSHVDVHYHGKAAHASAFPQLGVNAADAITVAQTAIGLLRQHIRPTDRIHGIVTYGGEAPNVVPAKTEGKWYIRAQTLAELAELEPKVHACFEAGAIATGCTHEVLEQSPKYSEFLDHKGLQDLYVRNATALGREFPAGGLVNGVVGSTDMANVSLAMPTIHPMLGLGCFPISNHQPEFAAFCATPTADKALLDGATAMAWTVVDAATTAMRDTLLAV